MEVAVVPLTESLAHVLQIRKISSQLHDEHAVLGISLYHKSK